MAYVIVTAANHITCPNCGHEWDRVLPLMGSIACPRCDLHSTWGLSAPDVHTAHLLSEPSWVWHI